MRLIDADKIVYSWQQDRNGKFHDGVTLESIIDNIPTENVNDLIVKELEKIKEKINSEDVNCRYEEDYVYSSGLQKAIELINNRIKELKGGQE